jgi:hypothetical protein
MEQQHFSDSDDVWFNKDRSESVSNRVVRKFGIIDIDNPAIGLNVYKGAIPKEDIDRHIATLEKSLNIGDQFYTWHEAQVTSSNIPVKKARDCSDFKFKPEDLGPRNEKNAELLDMHKSVYDIVKSCVDDYCAYWGISVVYYEAFNFVKYEGEGKHFRIHADHGPAYNTTVSIVVYLNDDYEGGELFFPRLDNLVYKPKMGDIAIFPSNYIYEHASLPMKNGTKYCVVIMSDINMLGHR